MIVGGSCKSEIVVLVLLTPVEAAIPRLSGFFLNADSESRSIDHVLNLRGQEDEENRIGTNMPLGL